MEKHHHIFKYNNSLDLETGGVLNGLELHYTTIGNLNKDKSNIIWVCHALTGNSDFTSWWGELFKEDSVFNFNDYFIICANMPGSCYESTGPFSTDSSTGSPYFHNFPVLTNRDVVKAFDLLRQELKFEKINTLIGGSLGGQQLIEWAIYQPDVFENIIPLACNAWHSPWGIAFNEAQRMAIEADPTWKLSQVDAGREGLKSARAIGMISYRYYNTFQITQSESDPQKTDDYKASSYLRYQGKKLSERFNAFSYWHLSKMMDSHHVGRNRGSVKAALARIKAKALIIGIDTDLLFPIAEQQYLADHIPHASLAIVESTYGHDGFLVEFGQINTIIKNHLKEKSQVLK